MYTYITECVLNTVFHKPTIRSVKIGNFEPLSEEFKLTKRNLYLSHMLFQIKT
jgi:hypothetical protein